MSEDLIRRSDAIKAIEELPNAYNGWSDAYDKAYIIGTLEEVPSADRPRGWIPCSERLPREEEQDDELGVLVTLGNGYSGLQYDWYHDGHWYDWNGFIVAWMPLPEPWKGADDEDD